MERLVQASPANLQWQHDLAFFHEKIGDGLAAQGNPAEALKSYESSFAVTERLVSANPECADCRRLPIASQFRIGEMQQALGELPEALKQFQDGLAGADR